MHLREFKDKHKDKLGFVVGAGPSLRHVETDSLRDYVVFTTNSALLKFPNCDYFVTDDAGVCNWNYWNITAKESSCKKLLYKEKLAGREFIFPQDQVVFFDHVGWSSVIDGKIVYHKDHLVLTKDPEKPIIGARTSAASALHIAYIMGCNPIVLLGIDGCYEGRNRYYWQFPNQPSAVEYNNRIFSSPNRGLLRNKPVDNHCVAYDLYWSHFSEMNPSLMQGKIINASDGIVEIFPRISLSEVLKTYGDRKK